MAEITRGTPIDLEKRFFAGNNYLKTSSRRFVDGTGMTELESGPILP
jgi:hypothetical protein